MTHTQRKAIIVGGSCGVGLSVSVRLIQQGFHVIILDKIEPNKKYLTDQTTYTYLHTDLRFFEEELFERLSQDADVKLLLITAGIGRIAPFETFSTSEIAQLFTVNTVSCIQILKAFYHRLCCSDTFYCGIISSISGLLSSPLAAAYAASKASLCRLIESLNIELKMQGYTNRILNIAPASLKGTSFSGDATDIELLASITDNILEHLFSKKELFIPQYQSIFKKVIENYHTDPEAYGIHSYQYKQHSNRIVHIPRLRIGYLSGTFDLFHIGHLNLLKRAKQCCDFLIVGVHESGKWKGKETFIPFEERKEMVANCRYVDKVVRSCPEDSDAWFKWHYHMLFVGDDYKGTERFKKYETFFKDKGVQIVYFPYTKSTSSSQIRDLINRATHQKGVK